MEPLFNVEEVGEANAAVGTGGRHLSGVDELAQVRATHPQKVGRLGRGERAAGVMVHAPRVGRTRPARRAWVSNPSSWSIAGESCCLDPGGELFGCHVAVKGLLLSDADLAGDLAAQSGCCHRAWPTAEDDPPHRCRDGDSGITHDELPPPNERCHAPAPGS